MCFITEDGNYYELHEHSVPPFGLPPVGRHGVLFLDVKYGASIPAWLFPVSAEESEKPKIMNGKPSRLRQHMTEEAAYPLLKRLKCSNSN